MSIKKCKTFSSGDMENNLNAARTSLHLAVIKQLQWKYTCSELYCEARERWWNCAWGSGYASQGAIRYRLLILVREPDPKPSNCFYKIAKANVKEKDNCKNFWHFSPFVFFFDGREKTKTKCIFIVLFIFRLLILIYSLKISAGTPVILYSASLTAQIINQLQRNQGASIEATQWLWFYLHSSQFRPGANTAVRWPQWVAQGAKPCV